MRLELDTATGLVWLVGLLPGVAVLVPRAQIMGT